MKKIIIPFDGGHFSKGAFSFASSLHEIKPILLTGVFLPEVDYARFLFFPTSFAAPAFIAGVEDFEEEEVKKAALLAAAKSDETKNTTDGL